MTTRPNAEHGDRAVALPNEILRTVVGSGVHGLAIEGTDDTDLMGVFVEPATHVIGIHPPMDTYVSRTQPEGNRPGPDDTDLVLYSLRHYLRLAIKGNPTVLLPMFAPEKDVVHATPLGTELRWHRDAFLSQQAVRRFVGYLDSQHERMLGGGKRNRVPARPELVAKYGWDVKYGSHALRLAYQGWDLIAHGELVLPMRERQREHVLAVKGGQISREDTSNAIQHLRLGIMERLERGDTPLPETPDIERIDAFSTSAHLSWWGVPQ